MYAVTFHPDNTTLAVAGGDGLVRLFDSPLANLLRNSPAPLATRPESAAKIRS